MIRDRPAHLLADHAYSHRPKPPYALDWSAVPELVRVSILDLGGIQPVTGAMMAAAGGSIYDKPSEAEVALFRERRTAFQMVSVVATVAAVGQRDGAFAVTPVALSLIPASKRGEVTTVPVESVAALSGGENFSKFEPGYVGYDPFKGEWSAYGPLGLIASSEKGFLDEVGIVVDTYFLASEFDPDDVLTMHVGMPSEKLEAKYRKRRRELLFEPFRRVEARRIWGVETPIELFLAQELARHGLHPAIQMLITADGNTYPSWYHLWQDLEIRHAPELITEADLYFPDQRVAVFCDGSHHERRKQRLKDEAINARLTELGILPVRVPGRLINSDLAAAGQLVIEAVLGTTKTA